MKMREQEAKKTSEHSAANEQSKPNEKSSGQAGNATQQAGSGNATTPVKALTYGETLELKKLPKKIEQLQQNINKNRY